MTTLSIVIYRATGSMATSFLVWGKYRAYPQNDGDGVFVDEVEIGAGDTTVTYEWDTPNGQTNWKFIAAPKYMENVGLFSQLESA